MTVTALGLPSLPLPATPLRSGLLPPGSLAAAPQTGPMVDAFGRVMRNLRVSVTDRCNLRCTYCMPANGVSWLPGEEILTSAEIRRIISVAVGRLGIRSVRFTGGEPLLRGDLEEIIADVAGLAPRPEISLTTNGLGLHHRAAALRAAGLDRINVSLDTVDRQHFAALTRRDRLPDVLNGLAAARAAGLYPIKINAVAGAAHGLNDLQALLEFCLREGYQLRVIEQLPLDAGHHWSPADVVSAERVLTALRQSFALRPDKSQRDAAPATTWIVDGYTDCRGAPARVGVIGSVTNPFCGDCDRTRLTADGSIRNCLFAATETDLRGALRSNATDEQIAQIWRANSWRKLPGHAINDPDFQQPARPMSAIGG